MLILKNISTKDLESIKENNNKQLLLSKLNESLELWRDRVYLGKEDHRFNQGVFCTLNDIINLIKES